MDRPDVRFPHFLVRYSFEWYDLTIASKKFFDEVFLTPLDSAKDLDGYTKQLVYLASMYVCNDTGLENITDPRIYLAKSRTKKDNPDMPSFQQVMHGPAVDEWIKAMQF